MADKELTYEAAFPGRFLKAALFEGKTVTLTIARAYLEELEGEKGKEHKLILAFDGSKMELVCNKTNAFCIVQMFGNKIPAWVGKRVAFFPTKAAFGPKTVDAIRVYGSPDISQDIDVQARLGRKNLKTTLKALRSAKPAAEAPTPAVPDTPEDGTYFNPDAEPLSQEEFERERDRVASELHGEMVP